MAHSYSGPEISLLYTYFRKARNFGTFSDEDSDSDVCIIEEMESKMSYLKQMFPSKGEKEIRQALMDVKGDQETAFDILMGAGMAFRFDIFYFNWHLTYF